MLVSEREAGATCFLLLMLTSLAGRFSCLQYQSMSSFLTRTSYNRREEQDMKRAILSVSRLRTVFKRGTLFFRNTFPPSLRNSALRNKSKKGFECELILIRLDWIFVLHIDIPSPFLRTTYLPAGSRLGVSIPTIPIVDVVLAVLLWVCCCGCVVGSWAGREEGHCAEVDVGEVFSLVLWVSLLMSLLLLAVIAIIGGVVGDGCRGCVRCVYRLLLLRSRR